MDGTRKLYFVYVGSVGDLPFQAKLFKQERNFQTSSCCPYCLATKQNMSDVSDDPVWLLDEVPVPWGAQPHICNIPGMCSPRMPRHDVFHLGHLGVARHFYCSVVVLLAQCFNHFAGPGLALDRKLANAYTCFRDFCRMVGASPLVKEFTKTNFHAAETGYPDCSFKASDSVLIMEFLLHHMDLPWEFDAEGVQQTFLEALAHYDAFYRLIWSADRRWLTRSEAIKAAKFLDGFIQAYYLLAKWSLKERRCHFVIVPKLHYMKHLVMDMRSALVDRTAQFIPNPAGWATPDGEDYVGHISRPMRVLHSTTSPLRRLQVYRAELHKEWRDLAT